MSEFIFKEITREICPICGHKGWCAWRVYPNGDKVLVCKRDDVHANQRGFDGNDYIFEKVTDKDNAVYQELNQKMRFLEQFKKDGDDISTAYKRAQNSQFQNARKTEKKTVIDQINAKSHKELDKIYRFFLDSLVLDDFHYRYLKNEGWSDELIQKNRIRSFPERDFMRFSLKNNFSKNKSRKTLAKMVTDQFGENALLGVPGAYIDRSGKWTFAGPKGIMFPLYDTDGFIFAIRIRMDFMDVSKALTKETGGDSWYEDEGEKHYLIPMKGVYTLKNGEKVFDDEKTGKYRPFQSWHMDEEEYKKGFIKNSYTKGCACDDQVGIYMNPQRDYMHVGYITEGEKKGIFANDSLKAPFISLPGVSAWKKLLSGKKGERIIDKLKDRGVKMFVVAYDADKHVNATVMKQQINVVNALKKEGFMIGTAEWDPLFGKGIDDLLAGGHKPSYELA